MCVSHRDRLCRFGFELIRWLLESRGVELLVLDNQETSVQQEFTEDLMAIVHVFSCRFNGLRRYAKVAESLEKEEKGGRRKNRKRRKSPVLQDEEGADASDQGAAEDA